MTLDGYSTAFRHGKAETLYLTVPSRVAKDSMCPIKMGDIVKVRIEGNSMIFEAIKEIKMRPKKAWPRQPPRKIRNAWNRQSPYSLPVRLLFTWLSISWLQGLFDDNHQIASSRLLLRRARQMALEWDFPGGRGEAWGMTDDRIRCSWCNHLKTMHHDKDDNYPAMCYAQNKNWICHCTGFKLGEKKWTASS